MGAIYQRKQLLQLVRITDQYNDLDRNEFGIITGALTYKDKMVSDIMTPIGDVFMVSNSDLLDFKTMSKIIQSGYRCEGFCGKIVGQLDLCGPYPGSVSLVPTFSP